MQTELLPDFLHLFHCLGSARSTLLRLLDHFAYDPRHIRSCDAPALQAAGFDGRIAARLRRDHSQRVERDLAWAQDPRHHLICCCDPVYPELLRHIDDRPALLYASGNPALMAAAQIAVVGARHCTPGGAHSAGELAAQLATAGLTITSGLAAGIDSAAHNGALQANGDTIAVVGTGLDLIYPRHNRKLAAAIEAQGLMISEFALGTRAARHHFPQRNRIISGLSVATLVVEAAARSGSLITARLAAEQGREVFAVPGSIHNPLTRGCHQLLRDGAMLAEGPDDVLKEIEHLLTFTRKTIDLARESEPQQLGHGHRRLLEVIGYDPVTTDTLLRRSGLTIDQLSSMLLVLELKNFIQSAPGGCFVRI